MPLLPGSLRPTAPAQDDPCDYPSEGEGAMLRDKKNDRDEDDDLGLEIDSSGEIGIRLGGGLSVDSDGDLGVEIAPGITLDSDGDLGFKF